MKTRFHKSRHNVKLKGNEQNKKNSVHKQRIISIYINYAFEKKRSIHMCQRVYLTDYLTELKVCPLRCRQRGECGSKKGYCHVTASTIFQVLTKMCISTRLVTQTQPKQGLRDLYITDEFL